uniref:Potassium channel domain-containing protein n=1 Tax=Timema tahoe TaxID=61484 RepID=A0A7R9IST6_9NEOP|nr:unnamed protein product [Timema tahoe]
MDTNSDLPIIGGPVYFESDALDHLPPERCIISYVLRSCSPVPVSLQGLAYIVRVTILFSCSCAVAGYILYGLLSCSSCSCAVAGYGNTTPQTTVGKTAVILYGFLGCSGGILFFNLFLERIITFLAYVLRSCHLRRIKKRMEQGSLASRRASREDAAEASLDNWKPSVYWVMLYLTMASIVVASCAAAVYAPFEDWTYFEAIYFCFVSFATIGFGDYVSTQEPAYPHVHWYRFSNFVFLVLGCCCIYSLFNVTSIVIKQALNWMIVRLDCRCLEDATGAAGRAWRRHSIRMQSRRRRRRSSAGMPRNMRRGRKPHQIAAVLGRTTAPMCVAEGTKKPPDDSDSNYDSEGEGAGGNTGECWQLLWALAALLKPARGNRPGTELMILTAVSLAVMQKQLYETAQMQKGGYHYGHYYSSGSSRGPPAGSFTPGTVGPLAIVSQKLGESGGGR